MGHIVDGAVAPRRHRRRGSREGGVCGCSLPRHEGGASSRGRGLGGRRREEGSEGVKVEDSNFGGFFCICACHVPPCEGVWTKVAQLNKFKVLDFDFASSWT